MTTLAWTETNRWNRWRYSIWSSFYDLIPLFTRQRRRSLALLELEPGERVLLIGAGTGADLPLLPTEVSVLATDLTPAMLARARAKAGPSVAFAVMDGQHLDLADESFDAVVLHLILAVLPDAARCLRETARVLRIGGRVVVFDKFLADGSRPSLLRRLANTVARVVATDINRRLGDILIAAGAPLSVEIDEPAAFGGQFRILRLRKHSRSRSARS